MYTHKMTPYSQISAPRRRAGEEEEEGAEGLKWTCYAAKPWAMSCRPKQNRISAQCCDCNKTSNLWTSSLPFTAPADMTVLEHMVQPQTTRLLQNKRQPYEIWLLFHCTFLLYQKSKL